jgi:hypothetical protein
LNTLEGLNRDYISFSVARLHDCEREHEARTRSGTVSGMGGGPSVVIFWAIPSVAMANGGKRGRLQPLCLRFEPSHSTQADDGTQQTGRDRNRQTVESQPDDPRAHPRPSKPPRVGFPRTGTLKTHKGFAVAEEEIGMSLEEFKAVYGRGQAVEYTLFFPWRRFGGY